MTNNQVSPDLTLFNSADSQAVFGNLLTLPIGSAGCSTSSRSTCAGTGENTFPLLQKVLVNYGDRVGYADTLAGGARPGVRRRRRGVGHRQRARATTDADADAATPSTPPPDDDRRPARRRAAASTAAGRRRSRTSTRPDGAGDAQQSGDFAGHRPGAGRPADGGRRLPGGRSGGARRRTRLSPPVAERGGRTLRPPARRLVWWCYRRGVEQLGSSLGS